MQTICNLTFTNRLLLVFRGCSRRTCKLFRHI